jgi:hypothetical protein
MFPLSSLSEAEKVLREISGYNVQVITSSIYSFLCSWDVSVTNCYCKVNNFGIYTFLYDELVTLWACLGIATTLLSVTVYCDLVDKCFCYRTSLSTHRCRAMYRWPSLDYCRHTLPYSSFSFCLYLIWYRNFRACLEAPDYRGYDKMSWLHILRFADTFTF